MTDNWDDVLNENICPVCKSDDWASPKGSASSNVLLVGYAPDEDVIRNNAIFPLNVQTMLRNEFAVMGLDFNVMRKINLWVHLKNDNDACLQYGLQQLIKEAKNKKYILLMGSEVVKYITKQDVGGINGLCVASPYSSTPVIMAMINPNNVFGGTVGEVRQVLQKFSRRILDGEKK
jgi:hypothetical protein